jgi:hypothetical protein
LICRGRLKLEEKASSNKCLEKAEEQAADAIDI